MGDPSALPMTTASSEGASPGKPTYAVFNTHAIDYQEMRAVLAQMNRAGVQD